MATAYIYYLTLDWLIGVHTHTHTHHAEDKSPATGGETRDKIGESRGEAKKRKKPHNSCRRGVRNGGELGGNRKNRRQKCVGSVNADADILENINKIARK